MTAGNNIKFYREKNGLTQKELSQQIHVSRQTISNWENGISYPDIESTVIMSSIFNCSLDELLNRNYALVVKKLRIKKIVQKVNKYGTLLFLIANMITLFINFTIGRKLSWSLIPLASSILVVTFIQTFCRVQRSPLLKATLLSYLPMLVLFFAIELNTASMDFYNTIEAVSL